MASEKPFKPLEEFTEGSLGGFALIKQAKENPDVLVKDIQILAGEKEGLFLGHGAFLKDYDFATFKREVVGPIKFLQSRGFDKFIPPTEFVWAKDDDGKEKGFLLMKKVKGKEIEDLEEISPRIARELDVFLSDYFKVKSETLVSEGDIISPDIWGLSEDGLLLNNIIIGKVSGDKEEHVYLVDLYPTKGNKNYYKNSSVEKVGEQWLTLLNKLRQRTGGKYDFLPAQAALRNYLSVLENWQKRGGRKVDTPLSKEKEKPALEFEIKIGAETSIENIKSELLSPQKFRVIQFIGTDNLNLYIGNLGHSELMYKNGIQWRDVIADGYIMVQDGKTTFHYYGDNINSDIKMAVRVALNKFLKDIGL